MARGCQGPGIVRQRAERGGPRRRGEHVLAEALPLARELGNDGLIAEILNDQGDALYYEGDFKGARAQYAQAAAHAAKAKLRQMQVRAQLNLARVDLEEGRLAISAAELTKLGAEADGLGLKFEAIQCSLLAAATDLRLKDSARARALSESALPKAERLGARTLLAAAHHLLAVIDAADRNQAEARRHADAARQLVDAIRKDARSDEVLRRPDLKRILDQLPQ